MPATEEASDGRIFPSGGYSGYSNFWLQNLGNKLPPQTVPLLPLFICVERAYLIMLYEDEGGEGKG